MQNRSSFDKRDSKSVDSQSGSNKRILVTLTTYDNNAPLKRMAPCLPTFEGVSPNQDYKAQSNGHRTLEVFELKDNSRILTLYSAVAIRWNEDNTLLYLQRSQAWIFDPVHLTHTALCNHVDSNKPPAFYFSPTDNQFARVIGKNIEVFQFQSGDTYLELKTPADYRKTQEKEIIDIPLVLNVKRIVASYMDQPSQLFFSKPDLRVAPCLSRQLKIQVSEFLNLMNDEISSLMVPDQFSVFKLNVITFLMTELTKKNGLSAEIVNKSFKEITEHPFLSQAAEHKQVKKILTDIGDVVGVKLG